MFNKFLKLDWILIGASLLLLAVGLSALYSISVSGKTESGMNIF